MTDIISLKYVFGGNFAATVENLFYEISMVPTMISLSVNERKSNKQQEKEDSEEIKKSEEFAASSNDEEYVCDEIQSYINDTSSANLSVKSDLDKKSEKTQKIINFALYYMSHDAKLVHASTSEKELVNGIAELFGFGKIYSSDNSANLRVFDPSCEEFDKDAEFILSIADIIKKSSEDEYSKLFSARKTEIINSQEPQKEEEPEKKQTLKHWIIDDDGFVHPNFGTKPVTELEVSNNVPENTCTINTADYIVQGNGISDELLERLEEYCVPLLDGKKHRYEVFQDLIRLYIITYNGYEIYYTIDPYGSVLGFGKPFVICPTPAYLGSSIFVPMDDMSGTVKKVFDSPQYILSPEETQYVLNHYYFSNPFIYKCIDMSDTEFFNDLSIPELIDLQNKLSFVADIVRGDYGVGLDLNFVNVPRLRFSKFVSVNDFKLESDEYVFSPEIFASGKSLSNVAIIGLSYTIMNNDIIKNTNQGSVSYHLGN